MTFSVLLIVAAMSTSSYAQHALLQTKVQDAHMESTLTALKVVDTDGNGVVDKDEIQTFANSYGLTQQQVDEDFLALDTNGNGILEAAEIDKALEEEQAVESSREGLGAAAAASPATSGAASRAASAARSAAAPPASMPTLPPLRTEVANQQANFATAAAAPAARRATPAQGLAEMATQAPQPAQRTAPVAQAQQQFRPAQEAVTLLDKAKVLSDVVAAAGNGMARAFTDQAAKIMQQKAQDEAKAAEYDRQAQGLRGKASELIKTALSSADEAARAAAMKVLDESKIPLQALETRAAKAAEQAQQKYALADEHMKKVKIVQERLAEKLAQKKPAASAGW